MKSLIVYHSRTGLTKKVAEEIHSFLGGDIEEIVEEKEGKSGTGLFGSLLAAFGKRPIAIKKPRYDPWDYDLAVIGTPSWAGRMAPVIKAYLSKNTYRFKRTGLFYTAATHKGRRIFDEMENLSGKKAAAKLRISASDIADGSYSDKIRAFVNDLRSSS